MLNRVAPLLACALALAGCATEGDFKLPGVYRLDIQQGNVLEQEMLDKLKPGMDKNQVRFILGTPVIVDSFHKDRWEYIYSYSEGGRQREQRRITVFFKDEKLSHVVGNVVAVERKPVDAVKSQQAPVDVPLSNRREGFFSRLFNALPFVGDDSPRQKKAKPDEATEETGAANETVAAEGESASPSAALPTPEPDAPADGSATNEDAEDPVPPIEPDAGATEGSSMPEMEAPLGDPADTGAPQ